MGPEFFAPSGKPLLGPSKEVSHCVCRETSNVSLWPNYQGYLMLRWIKQENILTKSNN